MLRWRRRREETRACGRSRRTTCPSPAGPRLRDLARGSRVWSSQAWSRSRDAPPVSEGEASGVPTAAAAAQARRPYQGSLDATGTGALARVTFSPDGVVYTIRSPPRVQHEVRLRAVPFRPMSRGHRMLDVRDAARRGGNAHEHRHREMVQ